MKVGLDLMTIRSDDLKRPKRHTGEAHMATEMWIKGVCL